MGGSSSTPPEPPVQSSSSSSSSSSSVRPPSPNRPVQSSSNSSSSSSSSVRPPSWRDLHAGLDPPPRSRCVLQGGVSASTQLLSASVSLPSAGRNTFQRPPEQRPEDSGPERSVQSSSNSSSSSSSSVRPPSWRDLHAGLDPPPRSRCVLQGGVSASTQLLSASVSLPSAGRKTFQRPPEQRPEDSGPERPVQSSSSNNSSSSSSVRPPSPMSLRHLMSEMFSPSSIIVRSRPAAASSSFHEADPDDQPVRLHDISCDLDMLSCNGLEMMTDPDEPPVRLSSSFEFLPPNMSELRVVLLGNSWSQRSSVGNFILGEKKFNTEREPDGFLIERGQLKEKEIVLINAPGLQSHWFSHQRMRRLFLHPGPHVFLLVLRPEDFTDKHKLKLCRFLQLFSHRSFHHSLVLISTPREESPGFMEKYQQHPPLKEMIRKCHYRFLWQKNLELPELLTRLGQTVRENNGEHLRSSSSDDFLFHHLFERDLMMSEMFSPSSILVRSHPVAASSSFYEADPDEPPVRLSSSFEFLPPNMSELRVVLLGNSWSQRSSVGNFILGEMKFNTEREPDGFLTERGQLKEKEIVLINSPDLLHPNISEDKLTEHVKNCVRVSDPGPHVFLLVLQPEDFTKRHKLKLCRFLQLFSHRSFDHSLVLISTPREESPGFMEKYQQHPPLKELIKESHDRFLWQKNLELRELLTRLGQTVRENNEKHLRSSSDEHLPSLKRHVLPMSSSSSSGFAGSLSLHDIFPCENDLFPLTSIPWRSIIDSDEFLMSCPAEALSLRDRKMMTDPDEPPVRRSSSFEFLPPNMSELRVVLLGNSWSQRSSVGNFILGEMKFNTEREPNGFLRERGQLKEKEIVLINSPDLLCPWFLHHRMRRFHHPRMDRYFHPGPHVFLLVLQPEDFTEEHKLKLCRFLQLFSDRSFHHSLVLISTPREESPGFMEKYQQHPPLKELIRKCHYRFLWQKNLELRELLTRLGQTVRENNGEHVSPDVPPHIIYHLI